MMQDQSRNRTPVPAAQPPAGAAPPEPGPARAEAGIARMLSEGGAPASALPERPAPGSAEAIEMFGIACRDLDSAGFADMAEMEAMRINNGCTLWTSDAVRQAQSGDFSRFNAADLEAARATPSARLDELLVMALRREMRMAEAVHASGIRQLYALAYPEAETGIDAAPVAVAIREHLSARAALNETLNPADTVAVRQAALSGDALTRQWMAYNRADAREREAWQALSKLRPKSAGDLARVMRYVATSPAFVDDWTDVRDGVLGFAEAVGSLTPAVGPARSARRTLVDSPTVDPHPAMMPEVMRLWHEHRRTMSGWGGLTGSEQDKAAGAAHNVFVEACLAVSELPVPQTPEGFAALVTAIGLAFEGCVDEGSDETVRAFGSLITAAVHASGAAMPPDWKGPLYETAAGSENGVQPAEADLQAGVEGDGVQRPKAESGDDPILAAIADHDAAYAAWVPLARAVNETPITDPAYDLAVAAAEIPEQREFEAYNGLFKTAPTTFVGLAALARYLPGLIRRNAASGIGTDCDALKALVTVCSAIGGIACSAEAAISPALRGLGGGASSVAAPLEERRTRTDKYLAMMEVDGFVPYPANNPRWLMAIKLAIPLEAERLLAIAQDEFDRCAEVYADFPDGERDGHLARLRAEYRLRELAAVVRGSKTETAASLIDQMLSCWREWSMITDPDRTESEEGEAREALGKRRYALIDAADALTATMESLPVKALALAWLEYSALWESEKVRDAYGTDGRLALDIDTAICGRLATEA